MMTKERHAIEDLQLTGEEFVYSDSQVYKIVKWSIDAPDCQEAGEITLRNLVTDEEDNFTIWQGDEDLTYYYICVDAEDEEDEDNEYDDVNIESLGIYVFTFGALSQDSRIKAAQYYATENRRNGRTYTFQHAYRKLLKGQPLLFDFDGRPAWVEWTEETEGKVEEYV